MKKGLPFRKPRKTTNGGRTEGKEKKGVKNGSSRGLGLKPGKSDKVDRGCVLGGKRFGG